MGTGLLLCSGPSGIRACSYKGFSSMDFGLRLCLELDERAAGCVAMELRKVAFALPIPLLVMARLLC